jgi:hypothetical protein
MNLCCGHVLTQSWSTHNVTFYLFQSIVFSDSVIACDMNPMKSLLRMFVLYTLPAYLFISREPQFFELHMINYIDHIIVTSPAKYPNA